MLYVDRVKINYSDLFHLLKSQRDFNSKETKTQYLYVLILNNWKRSIFEGSSLHQLTRVSLRRCHRTESRNTTDAGKTSLQLTT